MAADDSRALARLPRTHRLNLGGRFNGGKSFREVHCLREKRVRVLRLDPTGRGKLPRDACLFSITQPTNPPVPATSPSFSHY
jgi:uncharacterized protein with ACT and thioredoxin-like domain